MPVRLQVNFCFFWWDAPFQFGFDLESQSVQTDLQVNSANVGAQGGLGAPQGGRTDHPSQDLSHHLQGVERWVPSDGVGRTRDGQVTTLRGDVDAGSAGPWNDCAGAGALISHELGSGCIFCTPINTNKLSCSTV